MRHTAITAMMMAMLLAWARADDSLRIEWTAKSLQGPPIHLPHEKPTVLLFLQPDQPQSRQTLEQLQTVLTGVPDVQVVAVVSGKDATTGARKLIDEDKLPWPVVVDTDYAASGKFSVHVWPTTVIVAPDGTQVAHLAGLSKSYAKNLEDYLAHAAGRIDQPQLRQRLDSHRTVIDSPTQMAERHLAVAQRLLEKGLFKQAQMELSQGLKLQPNNPALQLAMAEALLATHQAPQALQLLDRIDPKAIGPWRLKVLRGRALVAMEQWEEAREILLQAIRLNPDPAEAYYELGRVYQHQGKWQEAAEAFRRAFETTPIGRKIAAPDSPAHPATTPP